MRKKNAWKAVLPLSAAAATAAGGVLVRENKALTVSRSDVYFADLPAAFDGVRLLHLSDLHAASFGRHQKRLLQLIDGLQADMALLTGDLIDRRRTLDEDGMQPALDLLRGLTAKMPVLRADGNHETRSYVRERFAELAAQTGAQNVTGRAITVKKGGNELAVVGLPDISDFDFDEESWRRALAAQRAARGGAFCIALSHRPQYLQTYAAQGWPLVLCGHAHGGQVRLPKIGGLYAPEQGVLPHYTAGAYTQDGTQMIVSRGLGNSGFPLRFGNRPDIGVLTLHCGK